MLCRAEACLPPFPEMLLFCLPPSLALQSYPFLGFFLCDAQGFGPCICLVLGQTPSRIQALPGTGAFLLPSSPPGSKPKHPRLDSLFFSFLFFLLFLPTEGRRAGVSICSNGGRLDQTVDEPRKQNPDLAGSETRQNRPIQSGDMARAAIRVGAVVGQENERAGSVDPGCFATRADPIGRWGRGLRSKLEQ